MESYQRVLVKKLDRSWVKSVAYRLIGHQDGTNASFKPKLFQKASQGMMKVAYKHGPYTKYLWKGQDRAKWGQQVNMLWSVVRHLSIDIYILSCDTYILSCFIGYLGRRIRWMHSFLDWTRVRVKVGSKNFTIQDCVTNSCLSCPVLSQD